MLSTLYINRTFPIAFQRCMPVSQVSAEDAGLASLIPDVVAFYEGDNAASIIRNGSNQVSMWMDGSGRGNHAVQGTASLAPVYVAAGTAGAGLYSNGITNKGMTFNLEVSDTDTYSLFVVVEGDTSISDPTGGSSLNGVISGGRLDYADSYIGIMQLRSDLDSFRVLALDQSASMNNMGGPALISATWDGTSLKSYRNGTLQETDAATPSTQTVTQGYLFRDDSSSRSLVGTLYDVLVVNRAVTDTERALIHDYFNQKRSIY